MSRTSTGSPINTIVAAIAGLGVFALLLLAVDYASGGRDDDGGDGGDDDVNQRVRDERVVVMTVFLGQVEEVFRNDSRRISIHVWIDGEETVPVRHEKRSKWTDIFVLPVGTEVKLQVRQHNDGGWVLCQITSGGVFVAPNGVEVINGPEDCNATGIVS